jgi:hypothetical protein
LQLGHAQFAVECTDTFLDQFVSTTIKTNIRAENRREATFSWLDGWTQLVDEKTERSRGMTLELSNWFWEGVMMKGGVLSIDRAYFDITGGRERWLYRVARKHAGGAGQAGFAISMPVLFEKSGAEGEAVQWVHEGEPGAKLKLSMILGNQCDDYQRCLYFILAGRGIVQMLDDLMWLEELLEARGRVAGKLFKRRSPVMPQVRPYVASEPDGPLVAVNRQFQQGASWYLDPELSDSPKRPL